MLPHSTLSIMNRQRLNKTAHITFSQSDLILCRFHFKTRRTLTCTRNDSTTNTKTAYLRNSSSNRNRTYIYNNFDLYDQFHKSGIFHRNSYPFSSHANNRNNLLHHHSKRTSYCKFHKTTAAYQNKEKDAIKSNQEKYNQENKVQIHSKEGELKSFIKHLRRESSDSFHTQQRKDTLKGSKKVVAMALASNMTMFVGKLYAAWVSGSSAMLSEALHSLADVFNESLLIWGIHRSLQKPDPTHPYGFASERYAWALVSGVGIFFLGGGVSLYHGISCLFHPSVIGDTTMAWYVLGASLIFESATMTVAYKQISKSAKATGVSFWEYMKRGADPSSVQVFLEDCAAVAGIAVASASLALGGYFQMPVFDALGSMTIGILLGSVATFLVRRNISSLVETSMVTHRQQQIVRMLERDPVVKSVHDVKTTRLGPEWVRFKAEILFDGQEVTRRYLELNKGELSNHHQKSFDDEELRKFLMEHGAGVISLLGQEVDRLEVEIQKTAPEVKHCDLEM